MVTDLAKVTFWAAPGAKLTQSLSLGRWSRGFALTFLAALLSGSVLGQDSLTLPPASMLPGGTATLNLVLSSPAGSEPAAVQFFLAYTPSDIVSISAAAGTSATAAGKSIDCFAGAGSYACMVWGPNTTTMSNGSVGSVTVTLASGVTSTAIAVANTLGASASGIRIVVSGAGDSITAVIPNPPVLSITKTHGGNFTQGQLNAAYSVVVSNQGGADATSGAITVTESPLPGLALASMSGAGWTCSGTTCSRSDSLVGRTSYPAITVLVNVAANAVSPEVNRVSVSGGGSATATMSDAAIITIATSPPVGSNGAPSGALASGTTSATLSLTTNEAATCAYSTSDVAFASMTVFSTTGGLFHSTAVSGLSNGQSYNYYVRCRDTFGDVDPSSFAIFFSVAQPTVVATPAISPNGGASNAAFTVTLSTTTIGAAIYYTTNNTPPTTRSLLYGGPFSVAATSTVQAMAAKTGLSSSGIVTAPFTISTAPPVRANGAPSGTLPSGTTSVTISLSTNENATCAYSMSDVAYASMTRLNSTGGLSHFTGVSGLVNGLSYTYYIGCLDSFGNANTNSYLISFSVILPPTTWYPGGWSHRKSITIDRANIAGALSNFPVLISVADTDLSANAALSGSDILFTLGDGLTKLNHQVESYAPATGTLNAWVNIPSLSPAANTTIYMYFGNPGAPSQANPAGAWDSTFTGVWHLNENPSTTSQFGDSTGNGNAGVAGYFPFTAANQNPGIAGGGLTFDGANQYIRVPNSAGLDSGAGVTVSTWVKTTTGNFNVNLVSKGIGCINSGFVVWLNENEKGTGMPSFWVGTGAWVDGKGADVSDGKWHHVTTTFDGTTSSTYVDGVLKGAGLKQGGFNSNAALTFGFGACGNYLAGSLDEVRVSGVARSAAWIATEFASGSAPHSFAAEGALEIF